MSRRWPPQTRPLRSLLPHWLIFSLLQSSLLLSLEAEVKICLRSSGVQAVAWTNEHNKTAIDFAKRFAGEGTWVYIRQLDQHSRRIIENNVLLDDPNKADLAAKNDQELASNPIVTTQAEDPMWFIQSNNTTAHAGTMSLVGGLALEMKSEDESDIFDSAPVKQLAQPTPDIAIIDSQIPVSQTPFDPLKTVVLKINTAAADDDIFGRVDILGSILRADPDTVSIIDLMPQEKSEAQPWGYSEIDADSYAGAGRRFLSDLGNYGYAERVIKPRSAADFTAGLAKASSQSKLVMIIAESGDDGSTLRVPGTTEVADATKGFSDFPDVNVVGLFCNSHHAMVHSNTASFVGTIYSDQVQNILRISLDRRSPATVSEYMNNVSIEQGVLTVNAEQKDASGMLRAIGSVTSGIQSSPASSYGLALLKFPLPASAVPRSSAPATAPGVPDNSLPVQGIDWLLCFFVGILGGFLREFMRWKRLANAKRQQLYLKPRYLLISAVELCAGGLVALVFVHLSPARSFDLPISFVAGAAVEFIVRQAARGSMWIPKVPHGPGAPRPASVLEFLRA